MAIKWLMACGVCSEQPYLQWLQHTHWLHCMSMTKYPQAKARSLCRFDLMIYCHMYGVKCINHSNNIWLLHDPSKKQIWSFCDSFFFIYLQTVQGN